MSECDERAKVRQLVVKLNEIPWIKFDERIKEITLWTDEFHFYDAIAPIVEKDTIDLDKAFYANRYDKGDADYINCPMNKEEYETFYNFLINAETIELKEFENESPSSEFIAKYIYYKVKETIKEVCRVDVWETATSRASYFEIEE